MSCHRLKTDITYVWGKLVLYKDSKFRRVESAEQHIGEEADCRYTSGEL